jgi:hypothetical protein
MDASITTIKTNDEHTPWCSPPDLHNDIGALGAYLALPGEVFTGTVFDFLIKADEDNHRFTGREIIELLAQGRGRGRTRTRIAVLDRFVVMKKVEAY